MWLILDWCENPNSALILDTVPSLIPRLYTKQCIKLLLRPRSEIERIADVFVGYFQRQQNGGGLWGFNTPLS